MNATKSLSALGGYLGAHSAHGMAEHGREINYPAIAITRQTGARALTIASLLCQRLESARSGEETPPWSIWENQIIAQVLQDSQLPAHLAAYFPEERTTYLDDTIEDIVGLHPSAYEINEKCHNLINNLCRIGHVIIVGRASNLLARQRQNVLRVRLVGSESARAHHVMATRHLDEKEALAHIRREDQQRQRYARLNFNCSNVNDPQLNDLMINTDHLGDGAVAQIIEAALKAKVPLPIRKELPALH